MKPRKIIPRILGLTALAALIGAWAVFGPLVKGALSLQKLDEGGGGSDAAEISRYVIRFLSKGFSDGTMPVPTDSLYACSAFTVRDQEDRFMTGRNFDFYDTTPLILHSRPRKGYESISTFDLRLLGFGNDWKPDTFGHKYIALTTLFSLVTLPVEINASARALQWIQQRDITSPDTHPYATAALRAAAYTYVMAAITSLATLAYYVMIYLNRK